MERAYSKIEWENKPSTATPIDEDNLNHMDNALYVIDGRVVEHQRLIEGLQNYETRASEAAASAEASEQAASDSERAAKVSENNALAYSDASYGSALDSEAWAVGKRNNVPVGNSDVTFENNSKYYANQSKYYKEAAEDVLDSMDDVKEEINNKLELATFDVDANGNLVYTDVGGYVFTIDDNGMLNWRVA